MEKFFKPTSVAVIGVSDKPTNLARNIIANLQEFNYDGIIYAVGRGGGKIFGRRIYASVSDIPDYVDLAVILTPADTVADILDECGRKGVRHAIVQTGGFREYGEEGKERERKVAEAAKKHGIRFIGPNCLGTMDLKSGLILPFLVFKDIFTKGGVAIVSQSGGVAFTLLNLLASESIGISKVASIGNKIDVDENDLIEYLLDDPETDIIIVYLEGISDGKRLMELGRRSAKPILVHKANIGELGKAIAASHTAALSSDDAVVDAALRQSGIARFRSRTTLLDYLKVLPLPKMRGNNLAILSRSGGHAILAADAAETCGFKLAPFRPEFIKDIEGHLRAKVIKLTNPLDLGDLFDYDMYVKMIERTVQEKDVNGVVFLHTYFSATEGEASRRLIEVTRELSEKYDKPIGVCVATDEEEVYKLRKNLKQPVFTSPMELINALALVRDFHYGAEDEPTLPAVKTDVETAETVIGRCVKEKRQPLLQEGLDIFQSYGIPVIKSALAQNEKEAVKSADAMGYPVALKVVSSDISHKTDFGGVYLNIRNPAHMKDACKEMKESVRAKLPFAKIEGFIVQPMLKKGWEMIVGAKRDPNFGPVVLVGLGGIFVEVFKDTAMRVAPFSESEARMMLEELKGYPILKGARGGKIYDTESIVRAILSLSVLMCDCPEIREIDINPFYVLPEGEGALALDARVVLLDK